jgi:hypothetical protein
MNYMRKGKQLNQIKPPLSNTKIRNINLERIVSPKIINEDAHRHQAGI